MSLREQWNNFFDETYVEDHTPWWDTPVAYMIAGALFLAIAIGYVAYKAATTPPPVAEPGPVVVVNPNDINRSVLSKPVKQIVDDGGACLGVVRANTFYDGDCTEARGLPSITYNEFFPQDRMPLD
jgi:hypothetical protein